MSESQTLDDLNLDALKSQADLLGISYHPSISAGKLSEKIHDRLAVDSAPKAELSELTKTQMIIEQATRLIRCNITCVNPSKSESEGEVFSVGNSIVQTMTKFIQFNKPWFVPSMMLDFIRGKEYQTFITGRTKAGVETKTPVYKKEFIVELLPNLTYSELKALQHKQHMNESHEPVSD